MKVALSGFAPDLPPDQEGVVADCDAFIPTMQGLMAANSLVDSGIATITGTPTSAATAVLLDGTRRLFGATSTKIYEVSGTSWVDRSRAGNYSGAEPQSFTVFGNVVLNANRSEVIGAASAGAAFADIATAPKASILCTASGFVMALNTLDGVYGDRADGWWCSGLRDHTIWTPAAATQAANGRLLDTPGAIVAGATLGNDVVAYKSTSMYLGRYVGPPLVWQWIRVPGDIGCISKRGVVTVDNRHFFIGPNDFYVFDGTVPVPLNAPVREWFFNNLNKSFKQNIIGAVDLPRSLIYWYFPSTSSGSGTLDSHIVYNFRTNSWGKRSMSVQVPVSYVTSGVTYDGLSAKFATYADLPSLSFDSPFWQGSAEIPAVFQSGKIYTVTGNPGTSWLKTGYYGDMTNNLACIRVTPRWRSLPTTALMTNYYNSTLNGPETQDATIAVNRNRFDCRRSARWHSFKFTFTGPAGLDGADILFVGETSE